MSKVVSKTGSKNLILPFLKCLDGSVLAFLKCMNGSVLVSLKCMDGSVLAHLRFSPFLCVLFQYFPFSNYCAFPFFFFWLSPLFPFLVCFISFSPFFFFSNSSLLFAFLIRVIGLFFFFDYGRGHPFFQVAEVKEKL